MVASSWSFSTAWKWISSVWKTLFDPSSDGLMFICFVLNMFSDLCLIFLMHVRQLCPFISLFSLLSLTHRALYEYFIWLITLNSLGFRGGRADLLLWFTFDYNTARDRPITMWENKSHGKVEICGISSAGAAGFRPFTESLHQTNISVCANPAQSSGGCIYNFSPSPAQLNSLSVVTAAEATDCTERCFRSWRKESLLTMKKLNQRNPHVSCSEQIQI